MMGVSPAKRREESQASLWIGLNRLISLAVASCLAFTAYLQVERKDYIVWVPTFLIPAILTFILTLRLKAVDCVEVHAVMSFHIGCCLCHLVYLATRLIYILTGNSPQAFHSLEELPPTASYNPFLYRQTWECMAVVMVVAWLKFLRISTRENLREAGMSQVAVISPKKMLRMLCMVFLAPFCLLWLCWVGGPPLWVAQVARATRDALDIETHPQLPVYNPIAQPQKPFPN
ncbi:uncharacterized protein [Panulirus ornatus]|uniref:uncharacterized protein n=1 Tax=Panulirus ornatus TaxID=150431 RepID=UPI003A8C84A9